MVQEQRGGSSGPWQPTAPRVEVGINPAEIHQHVIESVEKAAAKASDRPPYKVEILLRQAPRNKNQRFYGNIMLYTRGTHVDDDEGVVRGVDSICGFCTRPRDNGSGGTVVCGQVIDHVFLFGDEGYCIQCRKEGKIGETIADSVSFSYGTLRKVAELLDYQVLARLRTPYFADIYLKRFLESTFTPIEQMKAGDLDPRRMADTLKKRRVMESVPFLEDQFRKARDAGASPVAILEHFLKA